MKGEVPVSEKTMDKLYKSNQRATSAKNLSKLKKNIVGDYLMKIRQFSNSYYNIFLDMLKMNK